jgi:hypothetical protein
LADIAGGGAGIAMTKESLHLDYESASPPHSKRTVRISAAVQTGTAIAANICLIEMANVDRSWGAIQIAILISPVVNLVLVGISIALTPLVTHLSRGAPIWLYVLTSIMAPASAIVVDYFIIGAMPLHGC